MAISFDDIPGTLPQGQIPDTLDLEHVASLAVGLLNNLQEQVLADSVCWRDLLAFTDTFRTLHGQNSVLHTIRRLSTSKNRTPFGRDVAREARIVRLGSTSWVEVDFLFSTREDGLVGSCAGIVSVIPDGNGEWKIWLIRTWLECFEGHGHPDHAIVIEKSSASRDFDHGLETPLGAIVVGGGQSGLSTAGRLQSLKVSYMMFEKMPDIGGVWDARYESLKWHTATEYGNLPFGRTFLPTDDNQLPVKRISEGQKAWSQRLGINVRLGTEVESVVWDEKTRIWLVHSRGPHGKEEWRARNLVLAIAGGSSVPLSPEWASPENIQKSGFTGTIMHSAVYRNPKPWACKRGIVVGVANTGFDVAEDLANAGMDTTMIQRNATFVMPVEWLLAAQAQNYNLSKTTEEADRLECTYPLKTARDMTNTMIHQAIKAHPERFDALEKAGFKLDRFGDIFTNLYIRFGGHYVDTGGIKRVVDGEIKVRAQTVKCLTPRGLLLEDGAELEADLIVLCTGFSHDFRSAAEAIIGHTTARKMDEYYGLNAEGEIQGYGRFAGQPHLYYFGGDTRNARFYSKFVALQIQKEELDGTLQPCFDVV